MTISSIGDLVQSVSRANPAQLASSKINYIDIASIDRDAKNVSNVSCIDASTAPSRARQPLITNDVLISTVRPNLNAVAMVPSHLNGSIGSTGFCVLRADPTRVLPEYLFYYSQSGSFVSHLTRIANGASYPAVSDDDILETTIPLPVFADQGRIVQALKTADRIRSLRRYALQTCDELLPATFQELFSIGTSLSSDTKLAHLDELCERIVVGHVGETSAGYCKEGTQFLRTQNVRRMRINREDMRYITPQFERTLKKSRLKAGDVLVSRVGANRGMSAVVPSDLDGANCANILVVTPSCQLRAEYLAFLVNSSRGQQASRTPAELAPAPDQSKEEMAPVLLND